MSNGRAAYALVFSSLMVASGIGLVVSYASSDYLQPMDVFGIVLGALVAAGGVVATIVAIRMLRRPKS